MLGHHQPLSTGAAQKASASAGGGATTGTGTTTASTTQTALATQAAAHCNKSNNNTGTQHCSRSLPDSGIRSPPTGKTGPRDPPPRENGRVLPSHARRGRRVLPRLLASFLSATHVASHVATCLWWAGEAGRHPQVVCGAVERRGCERAHKRDTNGGGRRHPLQLIRTRLYAERQPTALSDSRATSLTKHATAKPGGVFIPTPRRSPGCASCHTLVDDLQGA